MWKAVALDGRKHRGATTRVCIRIHCDEFLRIHVLHTRANLVSWAGANIAKWKAGQETSFAGMTNRSHAIDGSLKFVVLDASSCVAPEAIALRSILLGLE